MSQLKAKLINIAFGRENVSHFAWQINHYDLNLSRNGFGHNLMSAKMEEQV